MTPQDLSRLLTLHAIHGGANGYLAHDSAERLRKAGLIGPLPDFDAIEPGGDLPPYVITDRGRQVAEAMLAAGSASIGSV